jgi:hypothetical protein
MEGKGYRQTPVQVSTKLHKRHVPSGSRIPKEGWQFLNVDLRCTVPFRSCGCGYRSSAVASPRSGAGGGGGGVLNHIPPYNRKRIRVSSICKLCGTLPRRHPPPDPLCSQLNLLNPTADPKKIPGYATDQVSVTTMSDNTGLCLPLLHLLLWHNWYFV